jgi:methyl-accepting chemotaxis protein
MGMKLFLNLKTSIKLVSSFVLIAVLVFVVGFVGMRNMKTINTGMEAMHNDRLVPIATLANVQKNTITARAEIITMLYSYDTTQINDSVQKIDNIIIENNTLMAQYKNTFLTDDEKKLLDKYDKDLSEYRKTRDKMVKLVQANKKDEAKGQFRQGEELRKNVEDDINALIKRF